MVRAEKRYEEKRGEQEWMNKKRIKERRENKGESRVRKIRRKSEEHKELIRMDGRRAKKWRKKMGEKTMKL